MHKEKRRPKSLTEKVRINPDLGTKSKTVILYPYITEAFIGLVEDGEKIRGVYEEEKAIRIFMAEGMSRIDARELTENHKNRQGRFSPLFIKTLSSRK